MRRAPDPRRSTAASFPALAARLCDLDLEIAELERVEPTEIIIAHVAELRAVRARLGLVFDELDRRRSAAVFGVEAPAGRMCGAEREG